MHGLKQLLTHIARNRRRRSESPKSRNAALSRVFLYGSSTIVSTGLLLAAIGLAENQPSPQAVAFAATTTQLLVSALFASAMTGLNATTTANADNGKRSISLLFGRPAGHRDRDTRLTARSLIAALASFSTLEMIRRIGWRKEQVGVYR
jgi:hypothetical protein